MAAAQKYQTDLNHLSETDAAAVRRARKLARLMDDRFKIAGFGFGLDGIIGLIPVAGDLFTSGMGLFHLKLAHQLGAGQRRQGRGLLPGAASGREKWRYDGGIDETRARLTSRAARPSSKRRRPCGCRV